MPHVINPDTKTKLASTLFNSVRELSALNESQKEFHDTSAVFQDLVRAHLDNLITEYLVLHPSLRHEKRDLRRIVHIEVGSETWEPTAQDLHDVARAFQEADAISRVAIDLATRGVVASTHQVKARRIEVEGDAEFKLIPYYAQEGGLAPLGTQVVPEPDRLKETVTDSQAGKRCIQRFGDGEWLEVQMEDLVPGDVFRMIDSGPTVYEDGSKRYMAVEHPILTDGVWGICADRIPD